MVPIALPRSAPSCGICGPQPVAPRHVENREGLLLAVAGQGTNEYNSNCLSSCSSFGNPLTRRPSPAHWVDATPRRRLQRRAPRTVPSPSPRYRGCGDGLEPCGYSVNVLCCCGGRGRAAAATAPRRADATRSSTTHLGRHGAGRHSADERGQSQSERRRCRHSYERRARRLSVGPSSSCPHLAGSERVLGWGRWSGGCAATTAAQTGRGLEGARGGDGLVALTVRRPAG